MKKIFVSFLSGLAFGLAFIIPVALGANMTFPDVNTSDWFYDDVNKMVDWGVIQGNEDGTFAPERNVNRAELSAMWTRYNDYVTQESVLSEYAVLLYGSEILNELDSLDEAYNGVKDAYKADFCKEGYYGGYVLDLAEKKLKKLKSDFQHGNFEGLEDAIAFKKLLFCN